MKTRTIASLAAATAVAVLLLAARTLHAGTIDAVSGGSIDVTGGTTTATSATLKWSETETNGTLKIYLDTLYTSRTQMRDSMTVPAQFRGGNVTYLLPRTLKPGKKYNYAFQGWERYPNNPPAAYALTGAFTTDAATSVGPRSTAAPAGDARSFDASGRPAAGTAFTPRVGEAGASLPSRRD